MPISKPHSSLGASNRGSCVKLAHYLEKENLELERMLNKNNSLEEINLLESRKQYFFNHNRDKVFLTEVIDKIDSNIKKLGKKDEKFFAPTISFSQAELNHLIRIVTKKKEVKDVWQLNAKELERYNALIRNYIRQVMDNYAANFNRQEKGLKRGSDLVYFAKIEHFRKFKGTDEEVKNGHYKTGENKPGLSSHGHIVVSRKDKHQKLKLTPTVKDRKTNRFINGNKYRIGFDRIEWIKRNEETFDKLFNYNRKLTEMFENQNILKNGTPQDKDILNQKIERENKINRLNTSRNYNGSHRGLSR